MLTSSFLSSYASWKHILYLVFPLLHLSFIRVGNLASVLDESVLLMITGVLLTGESMRPYYLKFLWCCSFPLCEIELSLGCYDSSVFFWTTPFWYFWRFFSLILEFPGFVSQFTVFSLYHQIYLVYSISVIPKSTSPTRALPWVQTQWTFLLGCPTVKTGLTISPCFPYVVSPQ